MIPSFLSVGLGKRRSMNGPFSLHTCFLLSTEEEYGIYVDLIVANSGEGQAYE
jgi:hypothetical protein